MLPISRRQMLARVGTATVIELGTSRALGEVEALEALGIDPVHYLVMPRVAFPRNLVVSNWLGTEGSVGTARLADDPVLPIRAIGVSCWRQLAELIGR